MPVRPTADQFVAMPEWMEAFGYFGAFLGAILEGEVLFATAVQAARFGYLNFYGILIVFFLGTQAADWSFFLIGRLRGQAFIGRFDGLQPKLNAMNKLLQKRSTFLLLSYRFFYGFRIVLPLLFGLSSVPVGRFAVCSLISTTVWVLLIGNASYYFAGLLIALLPRLQQGILIVAPCIVALLLGIRYWRK